jgi:hypothetical protein
MPALRPMPALMVLLVLTVQVSARDLDGRYANSPLKQWFETLASKKGLCCSDADGTALSEVDWESRDGHYRVWLDGAWHDVPDDAVITVPNRAGKTMVWPMRGVPWPDHPLLHAGSDDLRRAAFDLNGGPIGGG